MVVAPESYCYVGGRFRRDLLPKASETARERLCQCDASTVIVLVGLPGSGKSTWASEYSGPLPVYDACNTTKWERARLLRMLAEHGKEARAVFVDTPVGLCMERDAMRPPDRQVGFRTITEKARTLQPPKRSEGFARVEMARCW